MSLEAKFELKINGGLVMQIEVHPQTHPEAIADMLEDAATSIREGVDTMMEPGESISAEGNGTSDQGESKEPPPVEWRYFKGSLGSTPAPPINSYLTSTKSTATH